VCRSIARVFWAKPVSRLAESSNLAARQFALKMNCVLMKTTELKMLWKLVRDGEKRALSAAGLALLFRIRSALQEWERSEIKGAAGRLSSVKLAPRCGQA
jgi:hypothetical protein